MSDTSRTKVFKYLLRVFNVINIINDTVKYNWRLVKFVDGQKFEIEALDILRQIDKLQTLF